MNATDPMFALKYVRMFTAATYADATSAIYCKMIPTSVVLQVGTSIASGCFNISKSYLPCYSYLLTPYDTLFIITSLDCKKDWLVVFLQNIVRFMLPVIDKCKNRPPFEIRWPFCVKR